MFTRQRKDVCRRSKGNNLNTFNCTVWLQVAIVSLIFVKLVQNFVSKNEINRQDVSQSSTLFHNFPFKMATLKNKLAVVARNYWGDPVKTATYHENQPFPE